MAHATCRNDCAKHRVQSEFRYLGCYFPGFTTEITNLSSARIFAATPQKNGLCSFSSATVVSGPWPGQSSVAGGNEKISERTWSLSMSHEIFPDASEPAKIVSPM